MKEVVDQRGVDEKIAHREVEQDVLDKLGIAKDSGHGGLGFDCHLVCFDEWIGCFDLIEGKIKREPRKT